MAVKAACSDKDVLRKKYTGVTKEWRRRLLFSFDYDLIGPSQQAVVIKTLKRNGERAALSSSLRVLLYGRLRVYCKKTNQINLLSGSTRLPYPLTTHFAAQNFFSLHSTTQELRCREEK